MASDADEAASVVAWFTFYIRLYEDDTRVARPSRTLLQLLQSAFPSLYDEIAARRLMLGSDEWECVVVLLEAFYEVELGIDRSALNDAMVFEDASVHPACIEMLEFVVSALVQSDSKARFVGDIMTMEDTVQVDIMAVIERVLKHSASLASRDTSSRDESDRTSYEHESLGSQRLGTPTRSLSGQKSASSSPALASSHSPLHLSRNADIERLQRANDILKEESIHIAKELENIKTKLGHSETENATLREAIQSVKVQAEMDILKKERTVRSYFDERMHSLQRELDRVNHELEEKTAIAKDVNELRDEIDLLRPSAEKLARAESTLAKYKTKIEDLASVNEKLRRTEEANADLVEKNLSLESQAAKATSLQRKLAESKEANTAIQFHVSELESKLARLGAELEAKRLECDSTAAALSEANSLNNQLQHTVEQQIDSKGGFTTTVTGSAGGISELNPELMEKFARLEHENASLRSQVDGTTSERIDALLDDIEDLKRMKKSFESKYFDTNDMLKETELKLKNAGDFVAKLQRELDHRTGQLCEVTAEKDDFVESLARAETKIVELTGSIAANMLEIGRRTELEKNLNAEICLRSTDISSLQSTLRQTVEELQLSNERNNRLCEDVDAHQVEKHEVAVHRDQLLDQVQDLEAMCSSHAARIAELQCDTHRLDQQLDEGSKRILKLQESESRSAMLCEDLHGILVTKTEVIEIQISTISELTRTIVALESDLLQVKEERRSRDDQVNLLTERLHVLAEDLAVVQTKRSDLMSEVTRLEEQARGHQEALRQCEETVNATCEDYEQRRMMAEEMTSIELAALMAAHRAQLQNVADNQASLVSRHEGVLEKLTLEKADIITRMTGIIAEKCALLQQSMAEMNALRESHEFAMEEVSRLLRQEKAAIEHEKDAMATELEEYTTKHSFPDEEVLLKQAAMHETLSQLTAKHTAEKSILSDQCDSLREQLKRLQDANHVMKTRFESQEVKLREAVKSQLDANRKLVETNQAVKNELAKKEAQAIQLENAVTRLDSRMRMLERERTHYSSEDGDKRESDESSTSYSSQLNNHVTQITEELEVLRKENKMLQAQRSRQHEAEADERGGDTQHTAKAYLMDRIRQLELAKSMEEDKKRELLLINAKLIQDRKQIEVRNASESKEVHLLKEKVNTWMLRDERRKKEHEVFAHRVRELESENRRLRSKLETGAVEPFSDPCSQSSLDSHDAIVPLHSASSDDQENIPPPTENLPSPSVLPKKRKMDESVDDDSQQEDYASTASLHDAQRDDEKPVESVAPALAAATVTASAPRAKRRMSHFMSSRLTTTAVATSTQQEDEKPSECQQQ